VPENEEYDYTLIVGDNGIGFPESPDIKNSDTLF
jgi:two-component sensor histidine kinase